jgi:hypothetical protein
LIGRKDSAPRNNYFFHFNKNLLSLSAVLLAWCLVVSCLALLVVSLWLSLSCGCIVLSCGSLVLWLYCGCLVLSSCLVLSCLVLSCLASRSRVESASCPATQYERFGRGTEESCLVLPCLFCLGLLSFLSCLVLSVSCLALVLSCLVLSCPVFISSFKRRHYVWVTNVLILSLLSMAVETSISM